MMDFAQTWGILFSHPNSPPTIFGWAINSSLYRDPAFYLPIECYTGRECYFVVNQEFLSLFLFFFCEMDLTAR
jgi:hypothetical protein